MTYTNMALIALLVHCIVNYNVLRNRHFRNSTPAGKNYRYLALSMTAFFIFDALWGLLYDTHMLTALFADTVFYFMAMTATVFFWSRYVINYLQMDNGLIKAFKYTGWCYLILVVIVLALNFFVPIMFWFDENGVYHANALRHVVLGIQIILFLASAAYVLLTARGREQSVKRHYMAIGAFGIAMAGMVMLQVRYPLQPLYCIGCLLGTSILHTFVLEDLKEERRLELEDMVRREEEHQKALGSARKLAYKDSLTGVKNKLAYGEWEEDIDEQILKGEQPPFAVVVFDVNDLKMVNDLYGHSAGDVCIKQASHRICTIFSHSPVFRVGGDEFVSILMGEDYLQRIRLMERFNTLPENPQTINPGETVSAGMAVYDGERHPSLASVFEEADKAMYLRKQYLKKYFLS